MELVKAELADDAFVPTLRPGRGSFVRVNYLYCAAPDRIIVARTTTPHFELYRLMKASTHTAVDSNTVLTGSLEWKRNHNGVWEAADENEGELVKLPQPARQFLQIVIDARLKS